MASLNAHKQRCSEWILDRVETKIFREAMRWNWQDSPIPITASDIAPVQAGSRAQPENITPGQLSAPGVSIQNPTALPDPAGIAAIITAIQNGNMFRDMSGLAQTLALAQTALQASAKGATAVGEQAEQNLKTVMDNNTERLRIAAQLAAATNGNPAGLAGGGGGGGTRSRPASNITEEGARLNYARDMDARSAASGTTAARGTPTSLSSQFGAATQVTPSSRVTEADLFNRQTGGVAADAVENILASTSGDATPGGGGADGVAVDPFPSVYAMPFTMDPDLDAKLAEAINAATQPGLSSDIPISIVVLKDDGNHRHAGNRYEEMHYSGSMIKIAAMYAAFELRAAVNRVFGATPPKTSKDAIAELVTVMNPQIDAAAAKEIKSLSAASLTKVLQPNYATAFKLPPPTADKTDFTNTMNGFLTSMIVNGTNTGAGNTIHAVGFGYLTAALIKGGFFKPDPDPSNNKGLWLAGDFLGAGDAGNWTEEGRVECINDGDTAQGTTTVQMAKLITLMWDGNLVDSDSSKAMLKFLKDARDHGFKPWILRSKAGPANFNVTHNKLGEGFLKPANGGNAVMSEASIITQVKDGVTRRFVVVWQNMSKTGPADDEFGPVARIVKEFLDRV